MTMGRRFLTSTLAAAVAGLAVTAHAQPSRTFVSTSGSDANPCSALAPCRNFAAALAAVATGGEVVAVSSGGYGPFTVNRSVRVIAAPGVHAAVTATAGAAVQIEAADGDVVTLRGLRLHSLGATVGVNVVRVGTLHLETMTMEGFSSAGVAFLPAGGGSLFMTDSTTRDGGYGLLAAAATGTARAYLGRVRLQNGSVGLLAWNNSSLTVHESVASGNSGAGFGALATTGPADLTLESCDSAGNGFGIAAVGTSALVRASYMTITDNGTGLSATDGARILTRSNNTVEGHTTEGSFTGTFPAR